jgi:hypothetical protein
MSKRIGVLSVMLSLALVCSAWAQQLTDATPMTGRVASVDALAKTFDLETSTGTVVFKTDDRTTFMNWDIPSSLVTLKVGDRIRVTYSGEAPDRTAARVETIDVRTTYQAPGFMTGMMGGGSMMTGRVTSTNVSGRMMTIDTPTGPQTCKLGADAQITASDGSTDFKSIKIGDEVRIELAHDSRTANRVDWISGETKNEGTLTASRRQLPKTADRLPLLGAFGLVMVAAALVLRARRPRTI